MSLLSSILKWKYRSLCFCYLMLGWVYLVKNLAIFYCSLLILTFCFVIYSLSIGSSNLTGANDSFYFLLNYSATFRLLTTFVFILKLLEADNSSKSFLLRLFLKAPRLLDKLLDYSIYSNTSSYSYSMLSCLPFEVY